VRKKLLPALVALAAAFLSAAWFFRDSIASGGNVIPDDLWDGRLLLGLHEHWRLVFAGERPWNTIAMFWPVEGTLGYSDTFFFSGDGFQRLAGRESITFPLEEGNRCAIINNCTIQNLHQFK
jgi:hypothetical protein